jgi:hypothetical protein
MSAETAWLDRGHLLAPPGDLDAVPDQNKPTVDTHGLGNRSNTVRAHKTVSRSSLTALLWKSLSSARRRAMLVTPQLIHAPIMPATTVANHMKVIALENAGRSD